MNLIIGKSAVYLNPQITDITRTLPKLVCSTDYYPLLILHTGGEEAASRSLRGMKRDYCAAVVY